MNAEEWLMQLDYARASSEGEIKAGFRRQLKQVTSILEHILPDVASITVKGPTKASSRPRVEFHTPYGNVPLRKMSLGYRTTIAWMVDFARRMFERYPDSDDPMAEPAVVLLDEIDLHLHPQWQRKISQYLTERFPNTQFIVTAHSPLVVQSAKDANIAVLRREGDHVLIENDIKAIQGWRIDQIYTSDLFGLESARPSDLDEVLQERKTLATKSKLTKKDAKRLAELDELVGSLPGGDTAEAAQSMQAIDETITLLKKQLADKQ